MPRRTPRPTPRRPATRRRTATALAGVLSVVALTSGYLLWNQEKPAGATADATLIGTTPWQESGESFDQALARRDTALGRQQVLRIYYRTPPAWSSMPAAKTGRPLVVSFKEQPTTVLSGSLDTFYRNWFATAPTDRDIWWVYWHEPEDDIARGSFTAADYRAAFAHLDQLADQARNARLHTTQVLMDWTVNPASHRNWRDYYPGKDVIDVQAWDVYDFTDKTGKYETMAQHDSERPSYEVTAAEGNDYAIAEIGSTVVTGRPAWLLDVGAWSRAHGAKFVTYFDSTVGGDFRLSDGASQAAWKSVNQGTAGTGAPTMVMKPATNVTRTSATFHCSVDPHGLATEVWFTSWSGANEGFEESPHVTVTAPTADFAHTRTGLTPNTTYSFRCKARNAATPVDVKVPWLDVTTLQ